MIPTATNGPGGQRRVGLVGGFVDVGLDRLVAFPTRWSPPIEAQAALAEDVRAAGIELAAEVAVSA